MHEGSQSGLSHGMQICQWSCCGSQREYCSSCCWQYWAFSTSPFRQQKFLHSILKSAVPGGIGSNEDSTIQWAPADPPCTVCADRVSTRQNCGVQQKAITNNSDSSSSGLPQCTARYPPRACALLAAVAVNHQANLWSALLQNQHLQMACQRGVWARNCTAELNPTASPGRPRQSPLPHDRVTGPVSAVLLLRTSVAESTSAAEWTSAAEQVISIIRIIITLLLSRFCTAQSFKFFSP